ncbi:hypothetical protein AB0C13_12205 [Streptomyces sp. NPDC049099]|uniref:hypothetical protein n=1 Tax=Streptomyces sp. NPDC049099 TaxID=3155768 RepID=UPI003435574C
MTPWLRITFPCARLLLALGAALPAYGAVALYTTAAYAAEPAPSEHSERPGPSEPSVPGHSAGTGAGAQRPDRPDGQDRPKPSGHDHGRQGLPTTGPTLIPIPSDSASASYRPAAVEPTRAGSRAGEGRMRPGRPDGPAAEVEGDDDPVPTRTPDSGRPEEPETADLPAATPSAAPHDAGLDPARSPAQNAARQNENSTEPVLQILPLGSGLVLIGLGLALAFLALRLRRG